MMIFNIIFVILVIKYFQNMLYGKSTSKSMKSHLVIWNLNNLTDMADMGQDVKIDQANLLNEENDNESEELNGSNASNLI